MSTKQLRSKTITVPPVAAPVTSDLDAQIDDLLRGGIGWGETLRFALATLRANPLRTLLTALGVLIGVAAVVALLAIGRGSQQAITSRITANGANIITIRAGASSSGGVRGAVGGGTSLTMNDATVLADQTRAPSIARVSPEYGGNAQLVAGSNNGNARITGAVPDYATVHNTTVAEGSFITADQQRVAENVIVLGANIAKTLFPDGSALDQQVRVNGQSFKVVGVLTSTGGTGFGSSDDGAIVPLATAQRKLFGARAVGGSWSVSNIVVQASSAETVNAALTEAQLYERAKRGGFFVVQHSCGDVHELFPDLIEIGLDCYQTFQPEIYDIPFEEFWEREGRERVTWFEAFQELYTWEPPYTQWYLGGKLNVCFNCVDRHVEAGSGDKVAFHWE
ncbi:MAG: ABC transporter permease, partial [Chloroflexales bacterium]